MLKAAALTVVGFLTLPIAAEACISGVGHASFRVRMTAKSKVVQSGSTAPAGFAPTSSYYPPPAVTPMPMPAIAPIVPLQAKATTTITSKTTTTAKTTTSTTKTTQVDALAEVNLARTRRGLVPFIRDEALETAAFAAATARASVRLFGHTANDFRFLPFGARASAAGCAAYEASYGWMSCCTYENYKFAGAAYVVGADGKRYMHLFVR